MVSSSQYIDNTDVINDNRSVRYVELRGLHAIDVFRLTIIRDGAAFCKPTDGASRAYRRGGKTAQMREWRCLGPKKYAKRVLYLRAILSDGTTKNVLYA